VRSKLKKLYRGPTGELEFQADIRKDLKARFGDNIWVFSPPTGSFRGIPDILFCFYGFFIAFEAKLDGRSRKKHEVLQEYTLSLIRTAGSPLALPRVTPGGYAEVIAKLEDLERRVSKHHPAEH
jgi:hypothetical protein